MSALFNAQPPRVEAKMPAKAESPIEGATHRARIKLLADLGEAQACPICKTHCWLCRNRRGSFSLYDEDGKNHCISCGSGIPVADHRQRN